MDGGRGSSKRLDERVPSKFARASPLSFPLGSCVDTKVVMRGFRMNSVPSLCLLPPL